MCRNLYAQNSPTPPHTPLTMSEINESGAGHIQDDAEIVLVPPTPQYTENTENTLIAQVVVEEELKVDANEEINQEDDGFVNRGKLSTIISFFVVHSFYLSSNT